MLSRTTNKTFNKNLLKVTSMNLSILNPSQNSQKQTTSARNLSSNRETGMKTPLKNHFVNRLVKVQTFQFSNQSKEDNDVEMQANQKDIDHSKINLFNLKEKEKDILSKYDPIIQYDKKQREVIYRIFKKLVHDNSSYARARSDLNFVDKTMLIKNVLDFTDKWSHIIYGPRRWGKTTNLSMLADFFSAKHIKSLDEDGSVHNERRVLFKGTEIEKVDDGEIFKNHFAKYPVIYLDFSDMESANVDKIYSALEGRCEQVRQKFKYLLNDPELDEDFRKFLSHDFYSYNFTPGKYLHMLCTYLKEYFREDCIILIDEFDSPLNYAIQKSKTEKEKDDVFDLFSSFYTVVLKSNTNLRFGLLTGASRLVSAGIFSTWNNVKDYYILKGEYIDFYGFKGTEVEQLLRKLNDPKGIELYKQKIDEMYNGYKIRIENVFDLGNPRFETIYNPIAVCNAIDAIKKYYPEGYNGNNKFFNAIFKRYWTSTGNFNYILRIFSPFSLRLILKNLINKVPQYSNLEYFEESYVKIEELEKLYRSITTDTNLINIPNDDHEDIVFSFLILSGYLTFDMVEDSPLNQPLRNLNVNEERKIETDSIDKYVQKLISNDDNKQSKFKYIVRIPNQELMITFLDLNDKLTLNIIKDNDTNLTVAQSSMKKLLSEDYSEIDDILKKSMETLCFLILQVSKINNKKTIDSSGTYINENMIQNYITGLIPKDKGIYFAKELRTKKGIPDILYYSFDTNRMVLIEVKYNQSAEDGFEQTDDYCKQLKADNSHIKEILRISINYSLNENSDNKTKTEYISYMYALQKYPDGGKPEEYEITKIKKNQINATDLFREVPKK